MSALEPGMTALEIGLKLEELAEALDTSPQAELKWRLNQRMKGEDPGKPLNWRGL